MRVRRFATEAGAVVGALALAAAWSLSASAQEHSHASQHETVVDQKNGAGALVKVVREATERFKDVSVAEAEEYYLNFGCVSGSDSGAMGMHFVNMGLVGDGEIDANRPEIVIYEPLPNGKLRLIGADYLVLADAWNSKHPEGPPQIMGQLLHLFESPNRFGLPPFYTLHVWAWKENPQGTFSNWHSKVSCETFSGQ
jgi:hypothetical protein